LQECSAEHFHPPPIVVKLFSAFCVSLSAAEQTSTSLHMVARGGHQHGLDHANACRNLYRA
jgi:hypothetical protein